MFEKPHSRQRVSYSQLLKLWKFLSTHREIAVGYNKTLSSREHSKRMWHKVSVLLNFSGEGAIKSGYGWSKYWIDMKAKLKKKRKLINDSRTGTDGDPAADIKLSDIELKLLSIFDEDHGSGLPGVEVDPLLLLREYGDDDQKNSDTQSTASDVPVYLIEKTSESENQNDDQILNVASEVNLPSLDEAEESQESKTHRPTLTLPGQSTGQQHRNKLNSNLLRQGMGQGPRRRQRRPVRHMTAAEARERLVFAAEARARAEMAMSRTFERTNNILTEMTSMLKRIEARVTAGAPAGEKQEPVF